MTSLLLLPHAVQVFTRANKQIAAADGGRRTEVLVGVRQSIQRQLFELGAQFQDKNVAVARDIEQLAVGRDRRRVILTSSATAEATAKSATEPTSRSPATRATSTRTTRSPASGTTRTWSTRSTSA